MKKRENYTVDIFKFLFSLSIFFCHLKSSAQWLECSNVLSKLYWIYYNSFNRLIVPCFFIFSGFFLEILGDDFDDKKLCNYEKRLFILYISWSILYLPYIVLNYNLVSIVQRFFFYGSINHLWYLSSLFYAVLLIWLFKHFCSDRWLTGIAFSLYMVGYVCKYMPNMNYVIVYKKIFLTFDNGLFFGLVFVVLGAILKKYIHKLKAISYKLLILIFVISLACLVAENRIDESLSIQSLHYIALVPASYALAGLIIKSDEDIKITINTRVLRICSTVIYCSHFWGFYMAEVILKNNISTLCKCIITLAATILWCLMILKCGRKNKIIRCLY